MAGLDKETLLALRLIAACDLHEYAKRLGISAEALNDMETGRLAIPLRIRADAYAASGCREEDEEDAP